MKVLGVHELAGMLNNTDAQPITVLDVREPWELEIAPFKGSLNIAMGDIPARWQEIPDNHPIVCLCHHGMRSMQVAAFLERSGLENVFNLTGGIDAWARQIDPDCATY